MYNRVLVCGGRDYEDWDSLCAVLDAAHLANPIQLLIHGGGRGADTMAGRWAASRGIPVSCYPADWNAHRRAAGPIRNQAMLDRGLPEMVVAFPGGRGTADMTMRARTAGVLVVMVTPALVARVTRQALERGAASLAAIAG